MSSQNTLVTCALDSEVLRPKGTLISRQVYRDKAPQGSGTYKAMDENGAIEIIGGPGAVSGFPFGNDTDVAPNNIQTSIVGATLTDGYIFEVRNLTTNTGSTNMQINALGSKLTVDSDGNPLVGGELVDGQIYLWTYNLADDEYQLLGLARPSGNQIPIVRYVYVVQDASDQARMGGVANHVYISPSQVQLAYNAANALQIANGVASEVEMIFGAIDAFNAGSIVLASAWNPRVRVKGQGPLISNIDTISGDGINMVAQFVDISVNTFFTASSTANGGNIQLQASNLDAININADGAVDGNGGEIRINGFADKSTLRGAINTRGAGIGSGGSVILTNIWIPGSVNVSGGATGAAGSIYMENCDGNRDSTTLLQTANNAGPSGFVALYNCNNITSLTQNNNGVGAFDTVMIDNSELSMFTRTGVGPFGDLILINARYRGELNNTYVISNLTTIDCAQPTIIQGVYGKRVILSSVNAAETITDIINMPRTANLAFPQGDSNHPVRFYPQAGRVITFVHGVGATNPHCVGGVNAVIDGSTDSWIEFQSVNGIVLETARGQY